MNTVVAARLRGFGTTIFTEMTELARTTGSINLGQGFPETNGPQSMIDAARAAISDGANQYPPLPGIPELRAAIAAQKRERYAVEYDTGSEILVTAGATEALAATFLGLCEPGDEVIVFEPYYDSYVADISMAGGVRRPVLLRPGPDGRFGFDRGDLHAAVTPATRVLLLNSPHNPTGKVFTRSELELIAEVCREHDLIAITDEVYEYLAYDGPHIPLATLPGMRDRTLSISSGGKTFNATGWKIGWLCGPAELVAAARSAKQFLTFASGTPFQYGVAAGLREVNGWTDGLRGKLRRHRDLLSEALTAAGAAPFGCEGGYFLQIDVADLGYDDGIRFCRELPEQAGVVAIPSVAFYDHTEAGRTLVRFAFCKESDVIERAAERLKSLRAPSR